MVYAHVRMSHYVSRERRREPYQRSQHKNVSPRTVRDPVGRRVSELLRNGGTSSQQPPPLIRVNFAFVHLNSNLRRTKNEKYL